MNETKKRFFFYLLIWLCLDFVQAIFTPLHADEAYYALYGQHLAWGYYDHPPLVAIICWLSNLIGTGYLSVRFVTILMHAGTLGLVWLTLPEGERTDTHSVNRFFLISSSLFMFVLYGFITTPDAPLLFFTALFFFLYKKFLGDSNWLNALGMAGCMAAMLYSKYMAALLIVLVILSNINILKNSKFCCAGILALLLFAPHILWQIQNDFPSFKYHLVSRSDPFSINYLLEFIPNQLLVFNPACFAMALYFCWKERKNKDLQTRAQLFSIVGFIVFFWLMTIKGHAEPHWTVAISIPIILLLHQCTSNISWKKWLLRLLLPFAIITFIVRIILCINILPENTGFKNYEKRIEGLHQLCGSRPAVFVASFQNPSLYQYYTHENAFSVGSVYFRDTQFDLWQCDTLTQGKPAVIFAEVSKGQVIDIDGKQFIYVPTEHFQSANRIQIKLLHSEIQEDSVTFDINIHNNYNIPFDFNHPEFRANIYVAYLINHRLQYELCSNPDPAIIPPHGSIQHQVKVRYIPNTPATFCIDNTVNMSRNSEAFKVRSEN